jgi:ferredoxin
VYDVFLLLVAILIIDVQQVLADYLGRGGFAMIDTKHQIKFDPASCVGCMLCYKACFIDVIRWNEESKRPEFKYVEDCERCFCCQAICKKGCIEVVPDYSSESLHQTFDRYN